MIFWILDRYRTNANIDAKNNKFKKRPKKTYFASVQLHFCFCAFRAAVMMFFGKKNQIYCSDIFSNVIIEKLNISQQLLTTKCLLDQMLCSIT